MNDLVKLKDAHSKAQDNRTGRVNIVNSTRLNFLNRIRELLPVVNKLNFSELGLPEANFNDYPNLLARDDIPPERFDALYIPLIETVEKARAALEALRDKHHKDLLQLNTIKSLYHAVTEKDRQTKRLKVQHGRLLRLLAIVESERKSFVEGELASICGDADNMYQKIHPGESIGGLILSLKSNVSGSLELSADFQGSCDIAPQAYYSESHLDTLGLCVFLAFAKKRSGGNTIIAMDDVITSVDQAHMERFTKMLNTEMKNFNQLIITTHYRPWKDRYGAYSGAVSGMDFFELQPWSYQRGVRHIKARLSLDEIEEYLQEDKFDRQIVASKSGIFLEGLFDRIALLYGCRLPRRHLPTYTLGEQIDSIGKKLRPALSIFKTDVNIKTPIAAIIEEINSLTWIRNEVGCHFRLDDNVHTTEVVRLGNATVRFARELICGNCGELPSRDKSGSYWECRCGNTQMHPHAAPK